MRDVICVLSLGTSFALSVTPHTGTWTSYKTDTTLLVEPEGLQRGSGPGSRQAWSPMLTPRGHCQAVRSNPLGTAPEVTSPWEGLASAHRGWGSLQGQKNLHFSHYFHRFLCSRPFCGIDIIRPFQWPTLGGVVRSVA